jgi:hypothetical protein
LIRDEVIPYGATVFARLVERKLVAVVRLPLTPASVNLLTNAGPYGELIDYGSPKCAIARYPWKQWSIID